MGDTDALGRLFDKLDRMNERLARVETLILERNKRVEGLMDQITALESRVKELEEEKAAAWGVKGFVVWMITAGIALYGVIK